MVEMLEVLIDDFPGAANQTCCFLHILNLVVKSILKQFDLPKSKEKKESGNNSDNEECDKTMDQAAEELLKSQSRTQQPFFFHTGSQSFVISRFLKK